MNEAILKDSIDPKYDREWMFGKVTILAKSPPYEYDASIYGHLAVLICAEGWSITHLPSGMKVCDFIEYTDAIQAAELLEDNFDWGQDMEKIKGLGSYVTALKKAILNQPTKMQIKAILPLN